MNIQHELEVLKKALDGAATELLQKEYHHINDYLLVAYTAAGNIEKLIFTQPSLCEATALLLNGMRRT